MNNKKVCSSARIKKIPDTPLSTKPKEVHIKTLFENLEQEWLSTAEAAKYLRLSGPSLRNLTSNGQIPYYKLGGRNRYKLSDLRNLLCSSKKGAFHGN